MNFRKALGWDGIFPLIAAMVPSIINWCFPGERFINGLITELIPFGVAIVRANIGYRQLSDVAHTKPSIRQQVILALAILILLVFESLAVRIQSVNDAPAIAYVAAGAIYLTYFVLATFVFRTIRTTSE